MLNVKAIVQFIYLYLNLSYNLNYINLTPICGVDKCATKRKIVDYMRNDFSLGFRLTV